MSLLKIVLQFFKSYLNTKSEDVKTGIGMADFEFQKSLEPKGETINYIDGEFVFSNDFAVTRHTRSNEIINHFSTDKIEIRDIRNGWKHYTIRNIQIRDEYFIITFSFYNDILKHISFIVKDCFMPTRSWEDYSKEEELQNLEYYNNWLTQEIGTDRKFEWGSIGADYDSKGGGSSIALRFA